MALRGEILLAIGSIPGVTVYTFMVYTGALLALAMLLMLFSCYSFRHLFQKSVKGCAMCGRGGRKASGLQHLLNRHHYIFYWASVVLFVVHLGITILVSGLPRLTLSPSFRTGTLYLGWLLAISFFLWAGTCYYFRYRTERSIFRHPPGCGLEGGSGRGIGTGEKRIYMYHRYFLYLIILLLPLHPSAILLDSFLPGAFISLLGAGYILWANRKGANV